MDSTTGPSSGSALILASGSRYRASLLASAGFRFDQVTPQVDERRIERDSLHLAPPDLSVTLATAKVAQVAGRFPGAHVLGADQLGFGEGPDGSMRPVHKPGTLARAVEQLASLSGGTLVLVNGVVVQQAGHVDADPIRHARTDVHRVRMRAFTHSEARDYVDEFEPLDCVGSYRIEDGADLVAEVTGSGASGVMGLPVGIATELLRLVGVLPDIDCPT